MAPEPFVIPPSFMTNDQYLEAVLVRHELKPTLLSVLAVRGIVQGLQKWANVYPNAHGARVASQTNTDEPAPKS